MKNKKLSLLILLTLAAFGLNNSMLDVRVQLNDLMKVEVANADEDDSFPYDHTFIISAYYSPLPGQERYVTGSYSGDIRLNGRGTNGADGTPVYAGMVAAPKSYPFGTKLYVPGIGMTAVHDRGGAIVEGSSESGPKHDRLDVWMGYGDKGLRRALNWGMRTVVVTVYGIDDSISENVEIDGYSPDEKHNQEVFAIPNYKTKSSEPKTTTKTKKELFPEDIWYLDEGDEVKELQKYLKDLGYYTGKTDGTFGDETRMAVYLFQKDKGIITDITDLGAGHFGSQTRDALEEAINNRKEDVTPKITLNTTSSDKNSIKKLQNALSVLGYDVEISGKYDEKTILAVLQFQIDNDVINTESDSGAGVFGPRTMTALSASIASDTGITKKLKKVYANTDVADAIESKQILTPSMHTDLSIGDTGADVKRLQSELKKLGLLRIDPTGKFDEVTKHAVFKFQQINGIVADENSTFAGVFGPTTREKMNSIISKKNYYSAKISEKRLQKDT